ncbi:MAG: hypothetical protein OXI72_24105 [Gemmatimonadota bacterium]|nr:hypothetical protein [Gemmatimonadota bacterium]
MVFRVLSNILTATKILWVGACGLALLLFLCTGAFAQEVEDSPEHPRLGPPRLLLDQPYIGQFGQEYYQNYGFEDYSRQPPTTSNLRNFYNSLGDPLLYGTESIRWVERQGLGVRRGFSSQSEGFSHGQAPGSSYGSLFNYVIVGTDGTDAWQARAIYANELRSKFTPLTFKMANVDGLRIDVGTEQDKFSAIASNLVPNNTFIVNTMMLGTHYERKLGFLNFGTTFLNAHQFEPRMESGHRTLKGVVGAVQRSTALVAIRISDGSPQDGSGGPVLHEVKVFVNGIHRPEADPFVIRLRARGAERQSYMAGLLRSGDRRPLPELDNDYQAINRGAVWNTYDPYINYASFDTDVFYRGYEFPFWIDHLFFRDFKLYGADHVLNADDEISVNSEFAHELSEFDPTTNPEGQFLGLHTLADLPQTFDGEEYGILYVDLEPFQEQITSVNIELALANDYHVEVSEIDLSGEAGDTPNPNYRDRYNYATFFRTVAATPGNPQDGRVRTVRVKVGAPTGLSIYSANVYGVLKGFEINGEFSRSNSFYQYASGMPAPRVPSEALSVNALNREQFPGTRSTIADNAYYLTIKRDFDRLGLGAELFSMGALYNTELRTYIGRSENNFGSLVAYNNVYLHRLVEDNDDNDRYPDSWYTNRPTIFQGQSDIDGIFPGLDEDRDGIPDTNRNFNGTPDYLEPFLMYDSDPQVYDYGLDLNHNDFIDVRENDIQPDLPYDPGLRGRHLYGTFEPIRRARITLGVMDAEQIAANDPSDFYYGNLGYERQIPALGQFFGVLSVERVEDGVADPLSIYSDEVLTPAQQLDREFAGLQRNIQLSPFLEEPRDDPLLFKNSTYTRMFVDARWKAVPNLTVHNKVKYEINSQHEGELYDGTFQEGNRLSRLTMVHKADYLWQIRPRLGLFSGLKFRYLKERQKTDDLTTAQERHIIPLLKLQYELTLRTRFQLGIQGLGMALPYSVTNEIQPINDFEQYDAVLMMTNNSQYFGYIISTNAGIGRRVKKHADSTRGETKDEDFTSAFINVILGFVDET